MKAARKARDMRLIDEKYSKYGPLKQFVKGNPMGEAIALKLEKAISEEIVWYENKQKQKLIKFPIFFFCFFLKTLFLCS
jgi:hypothetical protein